MRVFWIGLSFSAALWSQAPSCPSDSVAATVMADVRLGSGGSSIGGLTKEDFLVSGKGVIGRVAAVTAEAPLDLLILIEAHDRKSALRGAVPLMMGELSPEDRLAVFHYGTGVERKAEWNRDWGPAEKALEDADRGIQVQTVRPLNAVVEGLRAFGENSDASRKRFVLLIGDEQDWSTPVRWESVLANLLEKRVTLSVVNDPPRGRVMGKILPKINVTPGNVGDVRAGETQGRFGSQSLSRLAEASGGDALLPNGVWFLEEMVKRMKERYLVTYCVEKRHAKRVPVLELTTAVREKHPSVALKIGGLKR